jgi:hypothetical protein
MGTLALAVATAFLARETRTEARETRRLAGLAEAELEAMKQQTGAVLEQAAAAERQADVGRQAVQGTIRPVLIDVPLEPSGEATEFVRYENVRERVPLGAIDVRDYPGSLGISVPLRNAGSGIALLTGLSLRCGDLPTWGGHFVRAVVPPGESTRVAFSLAKTEPRTADHIASINAGNGFTVDVAYSDIVGDQATITQLHITRGPGGPPWFVSQIFLLDPESPERPLAGSGASTLP